MLGLLRQWCDGKRILAGTGASTEEVSSGGGRTARPCPVGRCRTIIFGGSASEADRRLVAHRERCHGHAT